MAFKASWIASLSMCAVHVCSVCQLKCLSEHGSCGMQGVGESVSFPERSLAYFRALAAPASEKNDFSCAIEQHICEFHTERSEFSICLVEQIHWRHLGKPYLLKALRKRMGNRWMHKLDAMLNKSSFLHHSFSGDSAARSLPDQ